MANTYIEVDVPQLSRDTQELLDEIGSIKNIMEQLHTEFDELNGMWEGMANIAFRKQVSQDEAAMLELLERMVKLAECMGNAGKEYVKCETDIHNMIDRLHIV